MSSLCRLELFPLAYDVLAYGTIAVLLPILLGLTSPRPPRHPTSSRPNRVETVYGPVHSLQSRPAS